MNRYEPATSAPSWCDLVQAAPSLRRYGEEAAEAGRSRLSWWVEWVSAYGDFIATGLPRSSGCRSNDAGRSQ